MNRNSLPRWINSLIDRIADSPTSLIGQIAARRLGAPAPDGTVPSVSFDDRPVRVLIAPVNYSGQGRAWARALEAADPAISARNMAVDVPGGFAFESDLVVPVGTYHNGTEWQGRQFEAAASATHVLIEAEEPPFGRLLGRSVAAQTEALLQRGVDVAFLAHGTDVRLPSRHIAGNRWSHYADAGVYAPRDETIAARNIRFLEASGRPVFVSTPDLLLDIPSAHWCPVVVDPPRWAAQRGERRPGPLRVAHAPSVSVIKGTQMIMPALQNLEAEGVIALRLIQGVSSAEMPKAFADADVVIDQMRIGSYGVAACEALASGCVVVGHLNPQVRDTVLAQTGSEVPLVEADPETLDEVIRDLATRLARDDLEPLQRTGVEFAHDVHDGRRSARVLEEHWIGRSAGPHQEGGGERASRS
ncbi:hypothetical protein GCM10010458_09800 [Microbacterium luteolum]|uniref:Glycosyltransferase family 1 protein n=1 Tax=Microbacterium luteolum TaxID=69367 RepID=A0ABY7XNM1_MICLT|nr:hypothetical protein [Microbacterium luteolum]WDM43740.1 hypothetical protein KV395_11005 [Microbacterium luteolum]